MEEDDVQAKSEWDTLSVKDDDGFNIGTNVRKMNEVFYQFILSISVAIKMHIWNIMSSSK